MTKVNFQSIVWKEGKHYVAQCINIDISSFGKTKKEAISNLTEAIELYFEDSPKLKIPKIEKAEIFSTRFVYA